MRKKLLSQIVLLLMFIGTAFIVANCGSSKNALQEQAPKVIRTNQDVDGPEVKLEFTKGDAHNHPLMAVWLEDMEGNYLQTLYVAESIAKGVFGHGDKSEGKWMPGPIRRPAALPYWGHQRGVQAEDGLYIPSQKQPMPDAVTSATPQADFILYSKLDVKGKKNVRLFFEINQTWDWNEYWTNNKFPDDDEYKTSCQPALVYSVAIDLDMIGEKYVLELTGHSHYAGKNGQLFEDLSTITTAKDISKSITVEVLSTNN